MSAILNHLKWKFDRKKRLLRPYTMISCPRKKIRLQHIFKDRGNLSCLQQEPLNALQLITWMLIKRYRAINYLAVSRWGKYSIKRTLITDHTFSLQNFLFSTKQPGPCFSIVVKKTQTNTHGVWFSLQIYLQNSWPAHKISHFFQWFVL